MIEITQGRITQVYQSPRLSRKYVGSFIVASDWVTNYPELYRHFMRQPAASGPCRTYDVFEGWGCRVLEGFPGQRGIHVGRFLGEDAT